MTATVWPEVTLGDLCTFNYGRSLPATKRSGQGSPVFGSNGTVGLHSATLTGGPTIVIGRKGSFGEVHYSADGCWPIDTTYYVDQGSTSADLRWLYYRMRALGLRELNRAAAIPGLHREDAYRQRLLLPPIEEQRRIAAVLDKADELRAKRRAALTLLDTLTESIFLDMFGRRSGDRPMRAIEELASAEVGAIRTGPFGSQLLHSEFVEQGVAVLGIDNVVQDRFVWAKTRFITPEKYEKLKRFTVHPGDVLITIMGTCGRSGIVPPDVPSAINTKHLCCITLDQRLCLPSYLTACFRYDAQLRHQLGARQRGAVMPGLNMGLIKAAEVRVPPVELQAEFCERRKQVEVRQAAQADWQGRLDELFASLQQRAFRGEL